MGKRIRYTPGRRAFVIAAGIGARVVLPAVGGLMIGYSLITAVVAAGLGGSLLVSYAQARGETVAVSGSGGLMQRAERLVLQVLGCLLDPAICRWAGLPEGTVLFWVLVVMAVGVFGTAVHRTLWIARRLQG